METSVFADEIFSDIESENYVYNMQRQHYQIKLFKNIFIPAGYKHHADPEFINSLSIFSISQVFLRRLLLFKISDLILVKST